MSDIPTLREMLNHHSELAIPHESYFLMPLWDRFRVGRDIEKLLADIAFAPVWRWKQSRLLRRSGFPVPRNPGSVAR